MVELLYFLFAIALMLTTMGLTTLAIVFILKFAPDVPHEKHSKKS